MSTLADGSSYSCEKKLDANGRQCGAPATHLHDQPRGNSDLPKFVCLRHLVEAIVNGTVQLFLPAEIAAAGGKVEAVLDKVNDIERLCANCGAEVNGEPLPDATFEVSW